MKHLLFVLIVLFLFVAQFTNSSFAQAPANDNCAGATVISSLPYHTTQNTRLATRNASDPPILCNEGGVDSIDGKTVWFKYTADTTTTIRFSTMGSTGTPSTPDSVYDTVLGLFTGTCGSLSEVACNDDSLQGSVRQSVIYYTVQQGTTYYLLVAEWNNGGTSGGKPTGGNLVLDVFPAPAPPPPPVVLGPKTGSVANGAIATTGSFTVLSVPSPIVKKEIENENEVPLLPALKNIVPPSAPEGSNYKEDRMTVQSINTKAVVLNNFQGFGATSFFPPDPTLAVGPNHVVAAVNTSFRIFDKSGTILKTIDLDTWFGNVRNPVGSSDPQVLYDHYAHRWIVAEGGFDVPYSILISVSDDDNPMGTWYNWSLPAGLGDSVTNNLPDYPQIGYDEQAIYITTREFNPGFLYDRLRIVEKSQLYANTAGQVTWTDFWGFREPSTFQLIDGIRPSIEYGSPGVHFLVGVSPYAIGTFFPVWKITNPVTSPSVTATNVPVAQFRSAPAPNQLGGGTTIEGAGSVIRHKAVYRDSSLWIVHSIQNPTATQYSALHYVRIDAYADTTIEDMAMGLNGYWHFYPALMVDAQDNVHLTFSRSGTNEYAGAFISGRKSSDPFGLAPSTALKPGVAHYEVSTSRNRWGDYLGIGLDPEDSSATWVHGMYASREDGWSTWVGKMKVGPIPGRYIASDPHGLNFPIREIYHWGDTLKVVVTNNGLDTLTVSNLQLTDSSFVVVNPPILPLSLATFQAETIKVSFLPLHIGNISGSLIITSDDAFNPTDSISLSAKAYIINAAQTGIMYATNNASNRQGKLLSVNSTTGATSAIGLVGYDGLSYIRVRPSVHELYGIISSGSNNTIVRINSTVGDAHPVSVVTGLNNVRGLAFRQDTMIIGEFYGHLYKVNTNNGTTTQIATTGLYIISIDINPLTGELWASAPSGDNLDGIYKINLSTGVPTLVGTAGFGAGILDLTFDGSGHLYGVIGDYPDTSRLVFIDTLTGAGTIIGSMGMRSIQSLATDPSSIFPVTSFGFPKGWNLISVPVFVNSYSVTSLFPTASTKAFTYEGGYAQKETLQRGSGYWLKFPAPVGISSFATRDTLDTVNVHTKWNLVGSLGVNLPVSSINSDPSGIIVSNFIGYNTTTGYNTSAVIEPTKGYWVKVNAIGKLIYAPPTTVPKETPIEHSVAILRQLNTLIVQDKSGNAQTLFFGKQQGEPVSVERYEMPPVAPEGILDARFGANSMAVIHEPQPAGALEFPISIQTRNFPITISWHVDNNQQIRYSLYSTSKTSGKTNKHRMQREGTISLSKEETSNLHLRVEQNVLPAQFVLGQNYPNPFNPTTLISYQIPVQSYVSLKVFDVLGRQVATLADGMQEEGEYSATFSTTNLSSGIYFYRIYAKPINGEKESFQSVKKMLLLK